MKFRQVLCSAVMALTALAAPLPKPGTQFEIRGVDTDVVTPFVLDQRDMELTLELLILAVNNLGIIFKTLDLLADNSTRLQAVANATGKLIDGAGSINLLFNGLDYGKLMTLLNLLGLVDAVVDLGLVKLIADGILLDKTFRPKLERLIYNVGMLLRPALRYVFQDILGSLQKRAITELDRDDIKAWVDKRLQQPEVQEIAKRLLEKRDDASSSLFAELLGTQSPNGDNTIGALELFSTLLGDNQPATTTLTGNWIDALFAGPSPTTTATVVASTTPVQQSPTTTITETAGTGVNWLDALFGGASSSAQTRASAQNAATTDTNQVSTQSASHTSSDETSTIRTVTTSQRSNSSRSSRSSTTATATQANFLGALFGNSNSSNATTTSTRPQPTATNISFGTGNSTTNFGTLGLFITNVLLGVLGSGLVENVVGDFLNALNDTGVAVYVVQEFIGNDKYINMTEDLVVDIWNTGAINLNLTRLLTSVNFTEIIEVGENLFRNVDFGGLLDAVLAGNFTLVMQGLGVYALAVGDIVTDLENKGLFYELNNYVFGNSTTTTSAAGKEIVSSLINAKTTEQATQRKSSAATTLAISWSYFFTPVLMALGLMAL